MKKILFVIPSLSQTNGVTSFLMNYLMQMELKKIDITILALDLCPSKEYMNWLKQNNINLELIPNFKQNGFWKFAQKINNFFKKNNDFDYVYFNLISFAPVVMFFAQKNGIKKFAMHSHATEFSQNTIKKIIISFFAKYVISKCDYRFACSEIAGNAMFRNNNFTVIPNCINYQKFSFNLQDRNEIRKKIGIRNNEVIIGFVGRFTKQKNVFAFIDLAKKIKTNYRILMIGTGDLRKRFEENIKKENLENKVILIEECSEVYKYYSAMDLFVLPSHYEGLPIVAIEAQVNGLTTILSDTISKETKILEKTLFLDRNDLDNFILQIEKSEIFHQEKNIDLKFNIINQAEKYEKLLLKL